MDKIAVLLPCYNEGIAIAQVVKEFKTALPTADIYVYDNNSKDDTKEQAFKAGAFVRSEPLQGKGHVVRRMFADIEADIYVIADGDGTYDASFAPQMIEKLVEENLDMIVGTRSGGDDSYRLGHQLGNRLFNKILKIIFKSTFTDIFSGYRVFSKRFIKTFPALSTGFDIETELSVHALEMNLPVAEIETPYGKRPEGSQSKLNTYGDGIKILWRIMMLTKEVKPFFFFSALGSIFMFFSLLLAYPLFMTYLETGLVPRLPTAILCSGIALIAAICVTCGFILHSLSLSRQVVKRLHYLSIPAPRL